MDVLSRVARQGLLMAATFAISSAALAAGHFVRGPTASIDGDGTLTVTWKEAGLGDTVTVAYELSADAHAKYQCVNRGGNCPGASNKQELFGPVVATGSFSSGKNGSITGSLSTEPPAPSLVCPGNQVRKLVFVTYSGIAVADTTNDVVATASPSSLGISGPECP